MKFRNRLITGLVATALLAGNAQASPIPRSVVDAFSKTTNTEESEWSYRFSNDHLHDGAYSLLQVYGSTGNYFPSGTQYWHGSSLAVPGIGVNTSGHDIAYHSGFSNSFLWPDDTVWAHPASGGIAVISWRGDGYAHRYRFFIQRYRC